MSSSAAKPAAEAATGKTFTLTDDATGKSCQLPVLEGTMGPPVIDVRKLYEQTGHFTFDPSFSATGSCKSRITFIDGDEGILMHRGYDDPRNSPEKSSYLESLLPDAGTATCRTAKQRRGIRAQHHLSHHGARTDALASSAASAAMRTRWPSCAALSARCRLSITTRTDITIPSSA
jgi:citrate synthase